ncbi:MAG: PIN domain-containing protein [bacterium]|nr:PIN domain-containing protein [bacterium]
MQDYFIDTNIFIRSLVKDEKEMSYVCAHFLKDLDHRRSNFFTSSFVIMEVNFVLTSIYEFSKIEIIPIIKSIVSTQTISIIDRVDLKLAVKLYQTHSAKLTDCLIASIKPIYDKKMAVVSYDKDFDKIGVIRKIPDQIIKIK